MNISGTIFWSAIHEKEINLGRKKGAHATTLDVIKVVEVSTVIHIHRNKRRRLLVRVHSAEASL